jgi:hypothetical protein
LDDLFNLVADPAFLLSVLARIQLIAAAISASGCPALRRSLWNAHP